MAEIHWFRIPTEIPSIRGRNEFHLRFFFFLNLRNRPLSHFTAFNLQFIYKYNSTE